MDTHASEGLGPVRRRKGCERFTYIFDSSWNINLAKFLLDYGARKASSKCRPKGKNAPASSCCLCSSSQIRSPQIQMHEIYPSNSTCMARNSQHTKHKCIRGIENNDGQIYHAVNDFALIFLAIFLLHCSFFPPDTFQSKKANDFPCG